MPKEIRAVVDAARFRDDHLNLGLFALDANGQLLRSSRPNVRPGANRFDPESQGRDFRRQLDAMLDGLDLPKVAFKQPAKLTLPDVTGAGRPAGVRIYLTFSANRLNHYRTPTVEAVPFSDAMREALRFPQANREVSAEVLRPILEQLYPPAIMDGHGGCRTIDAKLTLTPAGRNGEVRRAVLSGEIEIELDNQSRTRYSGPLSMVVSYGAENDAPRTLRGVGSWTFAKGPANGPPPEKITMTAAIESRPD